MRDAGTEPHMSDLASLDLTDSALYRGGFPHAVFTRLRREAPVRWQAAPEGCASEDRGFWVLSRYGDIEATNRDTELFSARGAKPALMSRRCRVCSRPSILRRKRCARSKPRA